MRRTCQLCGGKLVNNVCVDCGLDNSKSDEMYTTEKSGHEHGKLTHVHNDHEDPYAGKMLTKEERQQIKKVRGGQTAGSTTGTYRSAGNSPQSYSSAGQNVKRAHKTTKRMGWLGGIVLAVLLLQALVIPIFQMISDAVKEEAYSWEDASEQGVGAEPMEEVYYDPYENVTRELSEDGEYYEVKLDAGVYKGGVHIPEGCYLVTMADAGKGSLTVDDAENNIYMNYRFDTSGADDTVEMAEDVRIYRGAIINVEETVVLLFQSENAQMDLTYQENPLKDSFVFSDEFVVGKDLPAGVYDVECIKGSGIFDYEICRDEEFSSYEGKLIDSEGYAFSKTLKNIVLPEGTRVEIQELTVSLTPSEIIESEDYDNFYSQ